MQRGFLRSLFGLALIGVLLLVTVINIWQANRIEAKQIAVLQRLVTVEKALENGSFATGAAGQAGGE